LPALSEGMAALLFLMLLIAAECVAEFDCTQYNRGYHEHDRKYLKVGPDTTSFAFVKHRRLKAKRHLIPCLPIEPF
ncbi:MAG: hypothetical protein MR418_02055, partial [Clostridiales bacterium]|nr:hypothetical protein [Clostridiales bacterium]